MLNDSSMVNNLMTSDGSQWLILVGNVGYDIIDQQ